MECEKPHAGLPFTGVTPDGARAFWISAPSGKYLADGQVGEEYGRLLIDRMRSHQPVPQLAWIVEDMVRRGPTKWSGVEVGFLQTLTRALTEALTSESQPL
jgi:hypothetical protein